MKQHEIKQLQRILTENELRVFECIVDFKTKHGGISPTLREITSVTNINSTSYVNFLVRKLAQKGFLEYSEMKTRSIRVVGERWEYELPVMETR